jgi:hypothetical protein
MGGGGPPPRYFLGRIMYFIIKGKTKFGRTRSEQEANLRKEGMRSLSDEQLDHMKFIEKRMKEQTGSKDNFVRQDMVRGESGIEFEPD